MSVPVVKSVLIESRLGEDEKGFCQGVEQMIVQAYGQRPEWLEFNIGEWWQRGDRAFREFQCAAGSVSLFLMREAQSERGFERGMIYCVEIEGATRAYEIAGGLETDVPFAELRKLGE
mgnify:CR=1 FL=1